MDCLGKMRREVWFYTFYYCSCNDLWMIKTPHNQVSAIRVINSNFGVMYASGCNSTWPNSEDHPFMHSFDILKRCGSHSEILTFWSLPKKRKHVIKLKVSFSKSMDASWVVWFMPSKWSYNYRRGVFLSMRKSAILGLIISWQCCSMLICNTRF